MGLTLLLCTKRRRVARWVISNKSHFCTKDAHLAIFLFLLDWRKGFFATTGQNLGAVQSAKEKREYQFRGSDRRTD